MAEKDLMLAPVLLGQCLFDVLVFQMSAISRGSLLCCSGESERVNRVERVGRRYR